MFLMPGMVIALYTTGKLNQVSSSSSNSRRKSSCQQQQLQQLRLVGSVADAGAPSVMVKTPCLEHIGVCAPARYRVDSNCCSIHPATRTTGTTCSIRLCKAASSVQ